MAIHATSLHFHRLIPTPYTIHADWRSDSTAESPNQKRMLEITSNHQHSLSICAEQHRCTSRPLPPETVMITTSTCTILHVEAGDQIHIAPIILHKVLVKEEAQIPQHSSALGITISSALADLLRISKRNLANLMICPKSYTVTRHNISMPIIAIRDEPQYVVPLGAKSNPSVDEQADNALGSKMESQSPLVVAGVAQGAGNTVEERQTDTSVMISNPISPVLCVWLRPDVITMLGLQTGDDAFLYQPPLATNSTVRVLQHPGFCYLSSRHATSIHTQEETIIALYNKKIITSYIQVHPLLEDMHESAIDFYLADALQSDKHKFAATPVQAQLYWIAKESVDDIRNKARTVVALPQETFTQGGYMAREPVSVFHKGEAHTAMIEPIMKPLPEGTLAATPLFVRKAKLNSGQGVFLNTDHTSFAIAKVGVLNIEELGDNAARGSSQLATTFPMPCRVELQNPARGTSLDILLKQDPYPREKTLVRMARTTRQMLLLERGDEVLVRPIIHTKNPQPLKTFFASILRWPFHQLLLLLINRRRILVSLAPAHTWDDQAQVARIDQEALTVLGMSEGDHLRVTYRGKSVSRIALARDTDYKDPIIMPEAKDAVYNILPLQFQIGLDALGRHKLGDGTVEFGTVVEVERDMSFILLKSLNLALLPVVGTVVTIITLFNATPIPALVQVIVGILLSCVFFYLALSVERAKVSSEHLDLRQKGI